MTVVSASDASLAPIQTRIRRWQPPSSTEIKDIRKQLKYTQRQFALTFGISVYVVRAWEKGSRIPDQTATIYLYLIADLPKYVASLVGKLDERQLLER